MKAKGPMIFLALSLSIILYLGIREKRNIDENKELGTACIKSYDHAGARTTGSYVAEFFYAGAMYKTTHNSTDGKGQGLIMNSCFPVVFNRNNPRENDLLIFPRDFERYNIEFPDSLNWVLKYQP